MVKRPDSLEYPKIWSRFTRTMFDGTVKTFKIQDVTENIYDSLIGFMEEIFLFEEPVCVAAGIVQNEKCLRQMKLYWREYVLPQRLSLVCFEDKTDSSESPVIIGVNLLVHFSKDEINPISFSEFPTLLSIAYEIYSKFNIYEEFNVTEYLTSSGLAVKNDYRGMNIGAELLNARTPLCKAMGFKVTESMFSVISSQILASKVGFETLLEIKYEDLEKNLDVKFPGSTKTIKIMTKIFV